MGQEQSSPVAADVPPQTLSERSLAAVAEFIKSGRAKSVVVLTGAGISTAAGIPDFRSPGTGLYSNLQRLNLPYAEAVFDISYFREHPEPFYVLAKELYPGNYNPTISHAFIALLAKKGLLKMLFTQNIDCLERQAGVPDDLIVEAHGSFATQHCIECGASYPDDEMREHVRGGEVPRCKQCNGLVKPDIVFFGESLPARFHDNVMMPAMADLVLILGTSLTVHPFASLPTLVPESVPRVLFNLGAVGGIGTRADDVLVLDSCDAGVRKLADALGWRDELEAMWRETVGEKEAERQLGTAAEREQVTRSEAEELAEEVEHVLKLGETETEPEPEPEPEPEHPEHPEHLEHPEPATKTGPHEGEEVIKAAANPEAEPRQSARSPEGQQAVQEAAAARHPEGAPEATEQLIPLVPGQTAASIVKEHMHLEKPEPQPKQQPEPEPESSRRAATSGSPKPSAPSATGSSASAPSAASAPSCTPERSPQPSAPTATTPGSAGTGSSPSSAAPRSAAANGASTTSESRSESAGSERSASTPRPESARLPHASTETPSAEEAGSSPGGLRVSGPGASEEEASSSSSKEGTEKDKEKEALTS